MGKIQEAEEAKQKAEEAKQNAIANAKDDELRKAMEAEKQAEATRKQLIEEARQKREAEQKAERIAEEQRVEDARLKAEAEAAKAKKEEEKREKHLQRLLAKARKAAKYRDVSGLRAALADAEAAGFDSEFQFARTALEEELQLRDKEAREKFLESLDGVAKSQDVGAMRSAIKEGGELGFDSELEPVRKALQEELQSRQAGAADVRKKQEELAAQFKTSKEAQEFGGAVLAAQWRAAAREVAKRGD